MTNSKLLIAFCITETVNTKEARNPLVNIYEIICKQSKPLVSYRLAVVHIHISVHAVADWHADYKNHSRITTNTIF